MNRFEIIGRLVELKRDVGFLKDIVNEITTDPNEVAADGEWPEDMSDLEESARRILANIEVLQAASKSQIREGS